MAVHSEEDTLPAIDPLLLEAFKKKDQEKNEGIEPLSD